MKLAFGFLLVAGLVSPLPAQSDGPRGLALFSLTSDRIDGWRLQVAERATLEKMRWSAGPAWLRLWAVGLQVEAIGLERMATKAAAVEAKRIQWMLVGPDREVVAYGDELPDFDRVEAGIRKGMGALPWDWLEALVRAQPEHGEARLALAEFALALSAPWRFKDSRPQANYRAFLPDAKAALEKLLAVPEWPWQVDLAVEPVPDNSPALPGASEVSSAQKREVQDAASKPLGSAWTGSERSRLDRLGPLLREQAPLLQDLLKRMAKEVLAALASDTENPRLQSNLAFLLGILDVDGAERLMGEIGGVEPLPGQAWPPLPLIHAQAEVLRRLERWVELLHQAQGWSRTADRLFLDRAVWDRHLLRESTLKAYEAMARSWREGWTILPDALAGLRQQAGGTYTGLARLTLRGAQLPKGPSEELTELFRLAALPSLTAPPMPAPLPPWRFEMKDGKDLPRLKVGFDQTADLLPWLPSEVLLTHKPLQAQLWSLSLGIETKAGGDLLPSPANLAEVLTSGRPGRLWVALDKVARAPEAIGRRRFRMGYLIERMPCRALESLLAGDLSLARMGADLNIEELDENLWFTQAQRVLPALEEHLRRWPMDGDRWEALAFWTSCLPAHQGPAALAAELPTFQTGLPFRLCLPASIHAQVGDQLCRQKAWGALRAWFEPCWQSLLDLGSKRSPSQARVGQAKLQEVRSTVQAFLDIAYTHLGLPGQRRALQEAGKALGEGEPRARH